MYAHDKGFIGIDVSKATLDISLSGRHFRIKNNSTEICLFIQKEIVLKKNLPKLVCLESTGGYELEAMQSFQKAEIPIHRAHPNKVHAFAKASGHFAKTDKLDAKLLEKYAAFVFPEEKGDVPISDAQIEVQELRSVERDLIDALHANKCRIKNSRGKSIGHLQQHVDFIQEQLKKVRKDIDRTISSDKDLKQNREILMSYKGVGKQVSSALIAELPELGKLTKKEIASLVGVAPKTYESGIKTSPGRISGGRFYVRKALYMSALVASKFDENMKNFYERLVAHGKAKKVALVAVMRKIIVCLNAMLRSNMVYSSQKKESRVKPPQPAVEAAL